MALLALESHHVRALASHVRRRASRAGATNPAAGGMRLTLTIYALDTGGSQRVATILANGWTRRGHVVTILTLAGPEEPFYPLDSRVTYRQVGQPPRSERPLPRFWNNIKRFLTL